MTQAELLKLLENEPEPIYKIEQELKMPKTTLQKAVKGERELPKKWAIAIKAKYSPKIQDLTHPNKVVVPITDKPKAANVAINTDGRPQRLPNEDSVDYAGRVNEWKKTLKS